MKAVKILTMLCAILFVNVCLTNGIFGQETKKNEKIVVSNPNKKDADEANQNTKVDFSEKKDAVVAEGQTLPRDNDNQKYRIGFQDTLEILVTGHSELSLNVNVNSDGTILMPKIDKPIVAACKTERELGSTVETLYKNILRHPFVNVRVVEQRSQPFAVIGAVRKPDSFYLNRRIRLLALLALAGGPDIERVPAKIQIARIGNSAGCAVNGGNSKEDSDVQFIGYKLNDVLEGKQNPWMEPGDIVSVLVADEAYVVGKVFKPAKISLKDPITLTQAIAIAGGLDQTANTDKVVIQRQESGSSAKTELVYNLKDISSKKVPDPFLQANDIVDVSNDKVKSATNGLLKAITGGIPSLFYRIPLP